MNVIGLCAGIGGLELGLKLAEPSARSICLVEWEPFAASVLAARMASGDLDPCPIYCDDLRRFDAAAWRGGVDVVVAGFPCQPFSTASRGRPVEPYLWPEVLRVVLELRPWRVFLENVQRAPIATAVVILSTSGIEVSLPPSIRPEWVPRTSASDGGFLPTLTATFNQQSPDMMKWPAYRRLALLAGGKRLPVIFWEWMMGFKPGWTECAVSETP